MSIDRLAGSRSWHTPRRAGWLVLITLALTGWAAPVLAETQYPPPPPPPPPAPAAPGQPYGPAPAPAQAPAPYYPRRGGYSYYQPNPAYALRGYIGFSG